MYLQKYIKYKTKYLRLLQQFGGNLSKWYITDYLWFSEIDDRTPTENPDIAKFRENLKFLSENRAKIVKEPVDASYIRINGNKINEIENDKKKLEDYEKGIEVQSKNVIIWGSPHWTGSSPNQSSTKTSYNDDDQQQFDAISGIQKNPLKYYPSWNYEYKDHSNFKGGIFVYLCAEYNNSVIIIPYACEKIPIIPYNDVEDIHIITVSTPGYIPSASHGVTERCEADTVKALIKVPKWARQFFNTSFDKTGITKNNQRKLWTLVQRWIWFTLIFI